MLYNAINFNDKFNLFNELWNPKVISEMNDYQFKLVKIQGDFQWHCHRHTDETFIVLTGKIKIRFRDGEVTLNEGEMYVVPKGKEHKPCAENLAKILISNLGVWLIQVILINQISRRITIFGSRI